MAAQDNGGDLNFDPHNCYREESFTDLRTGTIRRLVPVKTDGSDDPDRTVVFQAQASLMTPAGQLPINVELEADSLEAAIAGFGAAVEKEAQAVIEQLREMQRKQELASPLIQTPGAGFPGGSPGGGKIQF